MKKQRHFSKWLLIFGTSFFGIIQASAQWMNVGGNVSHNNTYAPHYSFARDNNDTLYVAFADNANQYIVTVKKRGSSGFWENVGTPGFITGSALFYSAGTSVAVNPVTNEPYLAICDGDNDNKVSVMRFNGTTWVYVGTPGFSSPRACGIKLAFTSTGVPYVAFNSCYDGNGISVMLFTGQWEYAGPQNFSTGNYVQMVIAPDNTVSVAFRDQDNGSKLSVKRFGSNTWTYIGTPGFSNGEAEQISIAADSSNALYVSYSDYSNANKLTVQKLTGNSWSVLGSPTISSFTASFTDININKFGVPYVSYVDGSLPVAQKFKNGAWSKLGNYIIAGSCAHTSILNDTLGNPYVLMALQPFSTLPFVYTYKPCNDTDYHFVANAVLDSAISDDGDSTTVTVTATGGQPPYIGTGTFKVVAGYYTYTITDGGGCTTTVGIDVPAPCTQNYWTGSAGTAWEDAANWSCGTVPDSTVVAYVTDGVTNYPVINSVVTCKQLHVSPGAMVRVGTGGKLNIIGP